MLFPRATARLQLHKGFTLDQAAGTADYFAALGISHLYLSPVFKARPGSTHGYDLTNPNQINPELGGEPAMLRLADRAKSLGLGLILDIVPNHMAALCPDNAWWTDVLRNGRNSGYAHFFDIDWNRPAVFGKVLLPILGRPYGEALAGGDIRLTRKEEKNQFGIICGETPLPLSPESQAGLRFELKSGQSSVDDMLTKYDSTKGGLDRLGALLDFQHYRLAWWRTAADEINWRRFFEISELVGMRVELPEVFETAHALVFKMYREGWIDGVRVDHVDGLADPAGYCRALRARLNQLAPERPEDTVLKRPYLIVEKILGDGEPLPPGWQIDGTTGYEFMSDACAVLHDPHGEAPLTKIWQEIAPRDQGLQAQLTSARREMIYRNFSSEFENLCRLFKELADAGLSSRDLSQSMIRRALCALLEHFRKYRTYLHEGQKSPEDVETLRRAFKGAEQTLSQADHSALGWLTDCFGLAEATTESKFDTTPAQTLRQEAITRFQQLTSPLAAKSLEDTVFYRYLRLLSRNDVGSDPARFALTADEFHQKVLQRIRRFPHSMLTTATHDHKRGEDGRARLAVISETPHHWRSLVLQWLDESSRLRPQPESPDPVDQYMIFQSLIGAWPNNPAPQDAGEAAPELDSLEKRSSLWLTKALREAKRHSNWVAPNQKYEEACQAYLHSLFAEPAAENSILAGISSFADSISPAGAVSSLTQVTLRLTTPGVPDLYQGTEKWDFSLVDPDNRMPVDFAGLRQSLDGDLDWDELITNWRDGRVKQALIQIILNYRRLNPSLFEGGEYLPLDLTGEHGGRALAFMRRQEDEAIIVAAGRLVFPLLHEARADKPLVPPDSWKDTAIIMPENYKRKWVNVLTGSPLEAARLNSLHLSEIFYRLPVAILAQV